MLAGRSSSLDTCFKFLENRSLGCPRAQFRFKSEARPVTTVCVCEETSRSAAIKHRGECSGNGFSLCPGRFCLCLCHVLAQLADGGSELQLLPRVSASIEMRIPGTPRANGGAENSTPLPPHTHSSGVFYRYIVGMPVGSLNQPHVGAACDMTLF